MICGTWLPRTAMLGASLLGCGAEAQVPHGRFPALKRVPLLEQAVAPGSPAAHIVKGARIVFAPAQPTGRHRHPVTVAGVVTRGEFTFKIAGQASRTLKAGDAFLEPAGAVIAKFDNASASRPAEIVAFYLTDSDARPLIELLPASPHDR